MNGPTAVGLAPSFGFGDRLGLATPGHVAAVRAAGRGLRPVFAQQSVRELARTGRSWHDVLASAQAGMTASAWTEPYGADADHCKEADDVVRARECGYTMFTLDATDRLSDGDTDDVAATWLPVVEHVERLAAEVPPGADLEVSIDEVAAPTTPGEHTFVATELRRRGVRVTSIAPRFPGDFEKGIDHRGSLDEFVAAVRAHARVARDCGPYKLSLHSGSDKLRLYRPLAEETRGMFHVKTAGTSYLEGLRVAGQKAPALIREIWACATERFAVDRSTYATTADVDSVPPQLARDAPDRLLDDTHARRILHVTFGSVLSDADLGTRLLECLTADGGSAYTAAVARHFVAHLEALAA
ncbi:MAG TPA: tagaturonate epimerase family protein [Gaiellaceae bacterium]